MVRRHALPDAEVQGPARGRVVPLQDLASNLELWLSINYQSIERYGKYNMFGPNICVDEVDDYDYEITNKPGLSNLSKLVCQSCRSCRSCQGCQSCQKFQTLTNVFLKSCRKLEKTAKR